jgi:hypothetical protein
MPVEFSGETCSEECEAWCRDIYGTEEDNDG